jgi:hypothetical protein
MKGMLTAFFIVMSAVALGQKVNRLSIGSNAAHYNDWKNTPLLFFNPEISFSRSISKYQYIQMGLNGLYGQATSKDIQTTGSVFQRLIFSCDIGIGQVLNNFSLGAGPSLRFRHEKKVVYLPQSYSFDFLVDPNKSQVDFGTFAYAEYEIPFNKKSLFDIRFTYRIYTRGVNPISLGFFYSRRF